MSTISEKVSMLPHGKKIPLKFDPAFKIMFANPDHIELLTLLLSRVLKIDYQDLEGRIELVPLKIPNKMLVDKKGERDIVVKFHNNDDYRIEIEVNVSKEFNQNILNRNLYYLHQLAESGVKESEKYNLIPRTYLINLNTFFVDPIHPKAIDIYTLRNKEGNEYTDKLKIYNINIAECYDLWYHNRYQGKYGLFEEDLVVLCASFMIEDVKTYNRCIEELHTTQEIKNTMKEVSEVMNQDGELYARCYNFEEEQAKLNKAVLEEVREKLKNQSKEQVQKLYEELLRNQAKEQVRKQVEEQVAQQLEEATKRLAKEFLKNGASVELVSKSTGLSNQKVQSLLKEIDK